MGELKKEEEQERREIEESRKEKWERKRTGRTKELEREKDWVGIEKLKK